MSSLQSDVFIKNNLFQKEATFITFLKEAGSEIELHHEQNMESSCQLSREPRNQEVPPKN